LARFSERSFALCLGEEAGPVSRPANDLAVGTYRNGLAGIGTADGVQVQLLRSDNRLLGQVKLGCPRGTDRKHTAPVGTEVSHRGKEEGEMDGNRLPGGSPVIAGGEIGAALLGVQVVSAHNDSVAGIAEGDGENAGRSRAVHDGRFGGVPGLAAIGGAQDSGCGAAGREPNVLIALHRDTGAAGGKRAFSVDGRGTAGVGKHGPVGAAVFGGEQFEAAVDGIAQSEAMVAIPERHAVEESFGLRVGELEGPALAGVRGFVDARLIAGAGAEHVSLVGAEGLDIAEIKFLRARHLRGRPMQAGVSGSEVRSMSAAGPNH